MKIKLKKAVKTKIKAVKKETPKVEDTGVSVTVHGHYDGKNYNKPFQVQKERRGVWSVMDMVGRVIITVQAENNELGDATAHEEASKINELLY